MSLNPAAAQIDLSKITPEQASVIAETRVERKGLQRRVTIKLHDKLNALVNLEASGLFKERHEHAGPDGEPINHRNFVEIVFVEPTKRKDEL